MSKADHYRDHYLCGRLFQCVQASSRDVAHHRRVTARERRHLALFRTVRNTSLNGLPWDRSGRTMYLHRFFKFNEVKNFQFPIANGATRIVRHVPLRTFKCGMAFLLHFRRGISNVGDPPDVKDHSAEPMKRKAICHLMKARTASRFFRYHFDQLLLFTNRQNRPTRMRLQRYLQDSLFGASVQMTRRMKRPHKRISELSVQRFRRGKIHALRTKGTSHPFPTLSNFRHREHRLSLQATCKASFSVNFVCELFAATNDHSLRISNSKNVFRAGTRLHRFIASHFGIRRVTLLTSCLRVTKTNSHSLRISGSFFNNGSNDEGRRFLSCTSGTQRYARRRGELTRRRTLLHITMDLPISNSSRSTSATIMIQRLVSVLPFFSLFRRGQANGLRSQLGTIRCHLQAFIRNVITTGTRRLLSTTAVHTSRMIMRVPNVGPRYLTNIGHLPKVKYTGTN